MQQRVQLSWKDRRKQKRRRSLLGSAASVTIIAVPLIAILIFVGVLSPVIGTAFCGGIGILIGILAWQFPRSSPPQDGSQFPSQPIGTKTDVLQVISSPPSNPFSALGKLRDPKDFYGRISERSTLIERTRRRASTSIVGSRRIGKTWLLQYLMLVAATKLGPEYWIVEMSAQSANFNTLVWFVGYVLEGLKGHAQRGTAVYKILEEALAGFEEERIKPEPNILAVLEKAIRDLSREEIVPVLCIDEFGNVTSNPQRRKQFNLDFFRSLRTMADSQNTNLVLVIASQDPLKKIVGRVGHESGFFNIFDRIMVRPFSLSEAEDFVQTKGDQAQLTDIERDYLLKLGGQGWWLWRKYWPIRLEQAGALIWSDRALNANCYQPEDKQYWRNLKRRIAEKSVF